MSEDLPEALRLKLYKKYMALLSSSQKTSETTTEDPEKYVRSKLSDDKAVELMDKLKAYYPDIYMGIIKELYNVLKTGQLKELDGITVYSIIRALGLDIKPDLRIKFVKHGKEVDINEYLDK
ncbi:MAG: hypothetical protein QXU13_06975 [Desulfurococcaceae archaeon]